MLSERHTKFSLYQKNRFAKKILTTLYNTVSGKKIAFLGWAFKKDTNDTRESAAIYVADALLDEQANIAVYDPKVVKEQMYNDLANLNTRKVEEIEAGISVFSEVYELCKDCLLYTSPSPRDI